jgi:hypothetical protein
MSKKVSVTSQKDDHLGRPFYRNPETVRAWQFKIRDIENIPAWIVGKDILNEGVLSVDTDIGVNSIVEGDWVTRSNEGIVRVHSDADFRYHYKVILDRPARNVFNVAWQVLVLLGMAAVAVASVVSLYNTMTTTKIWTPFIATLVISKDTYFFILAWRYASRTIHGFFDPSREGYYDYRYIAR